MEDLVYRTTVAAARRLLKTKMRLHISRLKASETSGDAWKLSVQMEESFRDEAQQAWSRIRACWASGTASPVARALLDLAVRSAFVQARSEVERHFLQQDLDPAWVQQSLLEYRGES